MDVSVVTRVLVTPQASDKARAYGKLPLTGMDLSMITLGCHKRFLIFEGVPGLNLEQASLKLKESLSCTLKHWYPLADVAETQDKELLLGTDDLSGDVAEGGFLKLVLEKDGTYAIDCNDAGVVLVAATGPFAKCDMSELGSIDIALGFAPDLPFIFQNPDSFSTSPLFGAQITKFEDGPTFAIGITFVHGVCDGTSIWQFMKDWADTTQGLTNVLGTHLSSRANVINLVPHANSATPKVDMPSTLIRVPLFGGPRRQPSKEPMQCVLLTVEAHNLNKLKGELQKEAGLETCSFTTYEAVTALIWCAIVRARNLPEAQDIRYFNVMNCRGRWKNLPENYFGNAALQVATMARAGELLHGNLAFAAHLIQDSLREMTSEHTQALIAIGEVEKDRGFFLRPDCRPGVDVNTGGSARSLALQCDFGWGAPAYFKANVLRLPSGFLVWLPWRLDGKIQILSVDLPNVVSRMCDDEELTAYVMHETSPVFIEGRLFQESSSKED